MKSLDPKALEAASRAFRRMHNSVCYPSASENEANWAASEIVSAYLAALDANTNPASSDLSSLRKGAEVAVKPLEWIDDTNKHGVRWVTRTPWGRVEILDRPNFGFSHMSRGATRAESLSGNSVDALKEAIQHVYETRIRSALVSGSREDGDG